MFFKGLNMESSLLNRLGLGKADPGLLILILAILTVILLIACVVLFAEHNRLKKRFERFSGGRNAGNLEQEIGSVFQENRELREQTEKNRKDIRILYRNMESAVSRVGLVKYDAFAQMGGKLSFALCMLDEKNNGFIINSVRSQEGCYTYSKDVRGGMCDLTLGAEEDQALKEAMKIK